MDGVHVTASHPALNISLSLSLSLPLYRKWNILASGVEALTMTPGFRVAMRMYPLETYI